MISKKKTAKKSQAKQRTTTKKTTPDQHSPAQAGFLIVGIGASAGGLEALEIFFSHVPEESNAAFIVIQHLDPTHKSIMGSLLKKYTKMEIAEIEDGVTIKKNQVYLSPPDHNIAIIGNSLHYITPEKIHGVNLPIDHFFRSLAEDQNERAIGIILSGTGSDGTLGIKAIKENGGMVMVQQEAQAKYNGMPKSAIDTGLVDFILPVEEMPKQIIAYSHHPYIEMTTAEKVSESEFQIVTQKILLLIRGKTGHDFSLYKQTTIRRRIERRMALHQLEKITDYIRYLERNPPEVESLFKELLINVTRFFRDPEGFSALEKEAIPGIFEHKKQDQPIRIWVPGCSTGEEAYSLVMLFTEAMEKHKKHFSLQVFASDIDAEAIEIGRRATYPESIRADVTEERLARFFTKDGNVYRVKKSIRECVVFALQDLPKDPPFSRLDMISCRNVLIYMDQMLQKKIFPIFQYSLLDRGILFLGTSESIGEFTDFFSPIDTKWKIYKRKGFLHTPAEFPRFPDRLLTVQQGKAVSPVGGGFRTLGEKVLAQSFAPPSVLINEKFDVLYSYGSVDYYLAIPIGEASLNILNIAREGLRHKLGPALVQALKGEIPVIAENVLIKSNSGMRTIDLVVKPIMEPGEPQRLMMVVFKEKFKSQVPVEKAKKSVKVTQRTDEFETLEQELKTTKEYLQNTIEELQTANEEFQSTNEELQSTNEELETSKEELQSTNEELVTVNSELQHKVDQLTETSNDVNNLLASTDIASIFLDIDLRIKRFTPAMAKIFRLLDGDAGRSIRDITSTIVEYNIYEAAAEVLATLVRKEVEVRNENDQWFTLRILPYRTMDNTIDGVVITLVDITRLKHISQELMKAKILAESIVQTIHEPFVVLDRDLNVQSVNEMFCSFFKVKAEETLHRRIYDLGNGQWKISQLQNLLESIIPKNTKINDYVVEHNFPDIGRKTMALNARRIQQLQYILLAFTEISDRKNGNINP
jgi:two-component system CheB/CheR fusion protein